MNFPAELANARAQRAAAIARLAAATTKCAKRDASEDVEFWGNKAAMLCAWKATP